MNYSSKIVAEENVEHGPHFLFATTFHEIGLPTSEPYPSFLPECAFHTSLSYGNHSSGLHLQEKSSICQHKSYAQNTWE